MGMPGGEKAVEPQTLQEHSKDVANWVVPKLHKAAAILNGGGVFDLEGGDFSVTCTLASAAYPFAVQFAFEDIKLEGRTAEGFSDRVHRAAKIYADSEEASRISRS